MTAYEIAELRALIGNRATSLVAMWFTATFGVFAAAYTVGNNLDTVSVVALLVFYTFVTLIMFSLLNVALAQMRSLAQDADKVGHGPDGPPAILGPGMIAPSPVASRANLMLMPISYAAFIFFVLDAAGWLA